MHGADHGATGWHKAGSRTSEQRCSEITRYEEHTDGTELARSAASGLGITGDPGPGADHGTGRTTERRAGTRRRAGRGRGGAARSLSTRSTYTDRTELAGLTPLRPGHHG